jgi:hypothetical protein
VTNEEKVVTVGVVAIALLLLYELLQSSGTGTGTTAATTAGGGLLSSLANLLKPKAAAAAKPTSSQTPTVTQPIGTGTLPIVAGGALAGVGITAAALSFTPETAIPIGTVTSGLVPGSVEEPTAANVSGPTGTTMQSANQGVNVGETVALATLPLAGLGTAIGLGLFATAAASAEIATGSGVFAAGTVIAPEAAATTTGGMVLGLSAFSWTIIAAGIVILIIICRIIFRGADPNQVPASMMEQAYEYAADQFFTWFAPEEQSYDFPGKGKQGSIISKDICLQLLNAQITGCLQAETDAPAYLKDTAPFSNAIVNAMNNGIGPIISKVKMMADNGNLSPFTADSTAQLVIQVPTGKGQWYPESVVYGRQIVAAVRARLLDQTPPTLPGGVQSATPADIQTESYIAALQEKLVGQDETGAYASGIQQQISLLQASLTYA